MPNSAFDYEVHQLSLFGSAGAIDLVSLRAERESLRGRPRSANTLKAYACDWRCFADWCASAGRPPLPASAETLAFYVTWLLLKDDKRGTTAARHLSAIADFHRRGGFDAPSLKEAREAIRSVKRRRREQPRRKAALAVDDLVRVSEGCDAATIRGARDRAIVILGFATSLRRSELSRLQLDDVRFDRGSGIVVDIAYSKTDQDGRGRSVDVWPGQRESTDPVRVLRAWIERRGDWAGPLFCRIMHPDRLTHDPIGGEAIAQIVKASCKRAGLDAALYAGHSLRAGAITASADLGRSDTEIMRLSGHKTPSVMRMYYRPDGVFRGRNPLEGVL